MTPPDLRAARPSGLLLGIDHLLKIRRDQLSFYAEMRARHGDAVRLRLGPYRLWLLFHPELIEPVLTRQAGSFIRFRKLMSVLRQWNGNSLLLAEGADWRERRRKVLPAFQTRRLPAYGATVVEETQRLCAELAAKADAQGRVTLDADAAMARLSLDVAVRTMFDAEPSAEGDKIEAAIQILSRVAFSESASPFTTPDWLPLPEKRAKLWAMGVMDAYVRGLATQALARPGGGGSLVGSLIEHHEGRLEDVRDDAMSLLIAGHETSGALLAWATACLGLHGDWLARVQAEIDEVLRGRAASAADLERLPVTRALLDEVLRLFPPAYTLFLREAAEDVEIGGLRLRRGDLAQITPWATQRDPRFFPDPERFDPGRFLRPDVWPDYAYLPFGAGPRTCIGRNFGLMETGLAFVTLLQHLAPEPLGHAPRPAARFSLRPEGGLPMIWRLRR